MTLEYRVLKGATDVSVVLRIIDSTDGTPETGVVWNTAGLNLQYRREGATSSPIAEANLLALTTAHTDGGFLHIGNGYYRFDVPDTAFLTGVNGVLVHGTVTGMVVIGAYVHLVDVDDQDGVRMGLTSLPNVAAGGAGGLPTDSAGKTSFNDLSAAEVNTEVDNALNTAIPGSPTTDSINQRIAAIDDLTQSGGSGDLAAVLVDTADMQPKLGSPAGTDMSADVAAVKADTAAILIDTNELQVDWTNGGRLDLLVDGIKAKTDNLPGGVAKNVALSKFPFTMVDAADFATPETGLTVTAEISKDGAAFAAMTNAVAEVGNGVYTIDITAAEMNADTVSLKFTASGAAQRTVVLKTDS